MLLVRAQVATICSQLQGRGWGGGGRGILGNVALGQAIA